MFREFFSYDRITESAFHSSKFINTKYRIFRKTQKSLVIIAGFIILPSVFLAFSEQRVVLATGLVMAYLLIVLSHIFVKKSLGLSVIILACILYFSGLLLLVNTGVNSAGIIYLLMMPLLFSFFLGHIPYLAGLFICFLTFIILGWFMSRGYLGWQLNLNLWVVIFINYLTCTTIICYVSHKLMVSLSRRMFHLDRLNRQLFMEKRSLKHLISVKDMLLKETHHRVGNNLQLISSIIHLMSLDHPDNRAMNYRYLEMRIKSISSVYFLLFSSVEDCLLDVGELIQNLCGEYRQDPEIRLRMALCISRPKAVSLALLVNEYLLIFNECCKGSYSLLISRETEFVQITFTSLLKQKHLEISSLSSLLIENLILQMQGSVTTKGEQICIILPLTLFSQERQ